MDARATLIEVETFLKNTNDCLIVGDINGSLKNVSRALISVRNLLVEYPKCED